MGGYGYGDERPPMPDRFIKGPPQATPRNQWPRDVVNAIKNPGDTGTHRHIIQLNQADITAFMGITPSSQNEGGPGSQTVSGAVWWSDIARFCRYVEVVSTGTSDKRQNRTDILVNISPQILDPTGPPGPFIWWFEDIVAARQTVSGKSAFHFGLTWENAIGVALAAPKPFVGIYANWSATAYGTWTARCVTDAGAGLNTSLGITTEKPHRLAFGLDGYGQVHFAIDGEELLTYDTTGSDLGTHTANATSHRWTVASDDGATTRAGYMMDLQSVSMCEVLDEAA